MSEFTLTNPVHCPELIAEYVDPDIYEGFVTAAMFSSTPASTDTDDSETLDGADPSEPVLVALAMELHCLMRTKGMGDLVEKAMQAYCRSGRSVEAAGFRVGTCLWYGIEGHGVGFMDDDYIIGRETAKALADACRKHGETHLLFSVADGMVVLA